ncbi:hypothetical protein [Streptomyces sp. NPDC058632]|uniref:hypothetical protein n=1 Tax=unclassified Streptomyces TaxID=2593676 RepID=UPI003665AE99
MTDFLSPPAWAADAFGRAGFTPLDAEEPTMPLASVHTGELAEAGLKQVRHWRPGTVGELMFNRWDRPAPKRSLRASGVGGTQMTDRPPELFAAVDPPLAVVDDGIHLEDRGRRTADLQTVFTGIGL